MFTFCPDCGAKDAVTKQDDTNYECMKCGWHFWNNAKATATTILMNQNGEILFAKRGIDPKKGMYDLPGGFVNYNENAYDAAIREIWEESGVTIKKPKLLGVWRNEYLPGRISTCDLMFITTDWQGDFVAQDDVEAFEWRPIDFIESDQFAWTYPGITEQLRAFAARIKNNADIS